MKNIKLLSGIVGLFIIMLSCSDESNSGQNKMSLFAKGTYDTATSKTATPSDVVITSFKINVTELSLKYILPDNDGNQQGNLGDDDYAVAVANGSWEMELLNHKAPITIITASNGTYKKAVVELNKNLVTTSPIYSKTIQITGYINGSPFVLWSDFNLRLELDYEDINECLIMNNNSKNMVFNFNLNQLTDLLDLSAAVDGNADGLIEIGPNDVDGNNELANSLNQYIGQCGQIEHQGQQ